MNDVKRREESPLPPIRVAVAMSGGVDSSVACLLLVKEGYDVVGLTMKLLKDSPSGDTGAVTPCCTAEMARDAAGVCHRLGVLHYTVNMTEAFEKEVIVPFVKDYTSGKTPNPCITCNRKMKFGHLLRKAREMGADYVATGHYVRAVRRQDDVLVDTFQNPRADGGRTYLLRGRDRSKDQSYALYGLTQDMLSHSMFPLGNLTKREVREMARQAGFSAADQPDSQEICFVSRSGYRKFLSDRGVHPEPGPIIDTSGKQVGKHLGLPFYTVGQRRGLGLEAGTALYVVALDVSRNALIVGTKGEAYSGGCWVKDLNLIAAQHLDGPVDGTCMVRYRGKETAAQMRPCEFETPSGAEAEVDFQTSQFAVTPGQALVFYQGNLVYGGGVISQSFAMQDLLQANQK